VLGERAWSSSGLGAVAAIPLRARGVDVTHGLCEVCIVVFEI
jgi:hypothetical protein